MERRELGDVHLGEGKGREKREKGERRGRREREEGEGREGGRKENRTRGTILSWEGVREGGGGERVDNQRYEGDWV